MLLEIAESPVRRTRIMLYQPKTSLSESKQTPAAQPTTRNPSTRSGFAVDESCKVDCLTSLGSSARLDTSVDMPEDGMGAIVTLVRFSCLTCDGSDFNDACGNAVLFPKTGLSSSENVSRGVNDMTANMVARNRYRWFDDAALSNRSPAALIPAIRIPCQRKMEERIAKPNQKNIDKAFGVNKHPSSPVRICDSEQLLVFFKLIEQSAHFCQLSSCRLFTFHCVKQ